MLDQQIRKNLTIMGSVLGYAHFFNRTILEASRCSARNAFCGGRPTIEIVGSGLSRRDATGKVVCVGREGWIEAD